MRSCTIELSGSEIAVLKATIDRLKHAEHIDAREIEVRVGDLEKILFGSGPW